MKLTREIYLIKKFGWSEYKKRLLDFLLTKIENWRRDWLFKKFGPKEPVVVGVLGSNMLLQTDYGISRDLFLDRIREPIATSHILKVLTKNDVVLEAGANIGYYVLIESRLCKKIYAVEAVSTNVEWLKKNIEMNQCKNVEVYELALGDKQGVFPMYISSKSNWHSFKTKTEKTVNVAMDTVDNFASDKDDITFVRMDVEGYELNILRGMIKTLTKVERIFIELHTHILTHKEIQECLDIMKSSGFKPELIVKCDRPGLGRVLDNSLIEEIYNGTYFGAYEIFFKK